MTLISSGNERIKAEVVCRVLDNEHIKDSCEFIDTEFNNDDNIYVQAKAGITPDNDLFVYFSIPKNTSNIFITVSDGDSDLVQKIIGNVEQKDVKNPSYFTKRNVVRYENQELNKHGVFGIVLLPLSVSGILDSMEEVFEFANKEYSFHLVTMLSKTEIELWEKDGFESLMEFFDSSEKDLLSFEQ